MAHLSGFLDEETVAGAVCPVPPDVVLLAYMLWQGIGICPRRHRLMECRVKDGHLLGHRGLVITK